MMKKGAKRILAALLSLSMVVSSWVPAITAEAATKLVNVALDGTASTESGENGDYVIGHVNDGDDSTSWQTPGTWPATAVIQLAGGKMVSKVVVKLGEKGDNSTGRTALVTVEYAMNGVIDPLFEIGSKRVTVDSDAIFELSAPSSATHVFVTLSDPQNADGTSGGFYPSVEEIEVYAEQEVEAISSYPNIASQATITATGNNEKTDEGSDNLVDGDPDTLYKFYNAAMTSEQSIILTYEEARSMDAFAIAFEDAGVSDSIALAFTYSILARNGNGEYDTIADRVTANRTDKSSQQYSFQEKTYSEVKIVMHSCTTSSGAGWPAVAEFEVYGNEILEEDTANIALKKSVHVPSGRNLAKNITDGSKNTAWKGIYYPAYVDIDLEKNYYLDTVEIFTPEKGYSQYTIYTSMDGRNFDKLAEKLSIESASLETGEVYLANGKEARIVRVYLEYSTAEKAAAIINEVRVTGTESGTPIKNRPAIAVKDYKDSQYANKVFTVEDTYNEVYGIIERRLGEDYKEWFDLEIANNPDGTGYDYFELSMVDGKVHVKGNNGVSLATGINHFLKYYCNVNISQVGDQVKMPAAIPAVDKTVHKETKAKVRYSYNYCTLSYSMAFWGEEEWRNELDWLALNGVNVVLDATAQEEVWRRFLGKLGYSHEEAKDFIAGPAYYAWAYMANLSGFGGPVHDSWFEERTELARKNQQSMLALGMQPALQGYSGMVPTDILNYATGEYALSSNDVISQGEWCGFTRPYMLRTTNAAFDKYAALFYQCQKEVYGDVSDYYATDPFHEGGNIADMNPRDISRKVLTAMLNADKDGIWIIQAWQGNPTTALLNGLDDVENGAQHALVLDLYAEKDPHYNQTGNSYGDTNEFDDTPWVFCMLNNFGGRLGLHGHLDNLAEDIPAAMNNSEHIAGIGITPEASVNNPVLYDFLFETVWQDDVENDLQKINLSDWLDDYATRRYGAVSKSANQAWEILKDTVYKSDLNMLGQGAPESVVNARPALNITTASSWGNAIISYDKVKLEEAAELLLEDYNELKDSEGYMYDVANVLQQILANSAQEYHKKMAAAYNAGDLEEFEKYSGILMDIIDYMETVTGTTEYFLLGRWIEQAKALAKNADDFTKELYELNAKALVTTWGSYNQTHGGQNLKDYSNRQWSGLIGDFYKERWKLWIEARTNQLKGESFTDVDDWFHWEWNWVRGNTEYPTEATPADLQTLGLEIIAKYTSANPAADASRDAVVTDVYAENYHPEPHASEGNPDYTIDGDPNTHWHTVYEDSARDTHYLIFTLDGVTTIDGMRFLQRSGSSNNGRITKFDLYVRETENDAWTLIVDDGSLDSSASWQMIDFNAVSAGQVKLQVVEALSDNTKKFATAAEIRFTTPKEDGEEGTVDKTALTEAIAKAEAVSSSGYTADSWNEFQTKLAAARDVKNTENATQEEILQAIENLKAAQKGLKLLVHGEKELVLKVGETTSFLDVSGTFKEQGFDNLDAAKAIVRVETVEIEDKVAKLHSSDSNYDGTSIDLSSCLYTFNKNADGTYCISAITSDGTQVYLNPFTGTDSAVRGYPNTTTIENITVVKTDAGFQFFEESTKDNGERYCLAFVNEWKVFNEDHTKDPWSNGTHATKEFKVYELKKSTDGTYTYQPVTGIVDGGQYYIAAELTDGIFVLRPSASIANRNDHIAKKTDEAKTYVGNKIEITGVSVGTTSIIVGTTKYNIQVVEEKNVKDVTVRAGETVHIFEQSGTFEESGLNTLDTTKATAGVETTTIKDKVATLHSGDANYDGTAIDLNSCLYTFNKNADGTYTIVAVTEDGKTVYLNPYTSPKQDDRGFPSTETPESITIVKGTNGFSFLDSSKKTTGENYRLTFVDGWKVFNENPSVDPGGAEAATTTEFKVYQLQKSADKYVYTEVTDLSAIQDGVQYYIAAPVDGVEYVLRPSASTISTGSRNDHIAKVTTTEKTVTGNEILINGVSAGDTQMTVGNTVYNIHVVTNEQNIEIKKGQSIVLEGSSLTKAPESEYATVEKIDGDNKYQLTGVLDGETTFVLDGVTYHVTVLKEEIASSVGTSNGMKVNRLTMSANNTFDLCVINSESAIEEWKVIDKETGEVADWASVDANGTVSAKDKADSVEHNGYIVAELADGTRIQIELKLSPAPTGTDLRLYDVYIDDLHHTDVWYGWIYEYDNPNSEDVEHPVLCGYTALTKVVEGEVIYVSMGGNYSNALDFFARPENGYALTQMGATGSHGHYMRLEGATPEDTEFIYTPTVAGNGQYHEISADATRKLVQQAMDIDCHGAQGFTRMNDDGTEGVSSILNYRSEKLPTVEKTAIGVSGPNGYTDNYREYEEGVKAQIGDYVYFKITVDTYECIDLVTYSKVMLDDQLEGAVFVTKEESGYSELTDADANTLDITEEIDVDAYEAKSHDYYVKYQIQAKDVASVSHSVVNTVALTYEYGTHYSNGTFESDAQDDAEIMILDIPLSSIVADYGLPVTYEFDSLTKYELVSEETSFGNVKLDVTQGDGKYNYALTYTAAEMLKGVDAVGLEIVEASSENEKVGDVKVVGVYPATTVYYEETFAGCTSGSGWTFPTGETLIDSQTTQYLEETSTGNYGYDEKYAVEAAGPSNASEAVSTAAGDTAEFTFKGEGIDIYANCQSEQAGQPTGTVTVLIKDKNNAIEKLMIVNTKVAGDPEGVTNAQNSIANAYNMPVISVNGLEQVEHSVKIVHTRSKEEVDASTAETTVTYPIRLDGFRVYNTLGKSDQSVYEVHKEANPNFTEMRNVVLNALNISSLYDETNDETNAESLYAEDIANGLTQVLDKKENGANAIILDNTVSSTDYDADNAQDFLDNGPKNELFLYQNQTLTFKLNAGLKNVQLGLKAANGPVTVTGTIAKNISSSTDMFYVIGDIDADTVITITNTSSNILSVTDLKYFTATPDAKVFCEITEETLTTALSAMGYPRKNETQEPADTIVRIAGSDRYATAYAVAEELKEVLGVDKFDAVIVATGKNFADALSGSYLASVKNAPILLANEKRTEELVEYVKANLAEDGTVYILGGTAAVPGTVEAGLEGIDVKRLYGEDRYGTNRAVLKEAGAVGRELLIATGRGYADSLSASATGKPILLVKDEITDAHREILRGFDGGKFYIIGGTGAVSEEIQAAIVGQGRIYRIAGENRYETSAKVAETFFPEAQTACFAYAKEFADGLSGGPLAAALGAPMILTADGKTDDAAAYVQSREIQSGIVFGGTARISDEAVGEIF